MLSEETTPRDRLRDAALDSFALRGLDASLRDIAADAGVTAGLITHHFGSKAALRDACDAEALRRIRVLENDGISRSTSGQLLMLGEMDGFRLTLAYLLRCLREGGPGGRAFLEKLISDAEDYLAHAVELGMIRPSRDPAATARYLVTQQMGGLLLQLSLAGDETALAHDPGLLHRLVTDLTLPSLELFTEGLLTSNELLEQYLATQEGSS